MFLSNMELKIHLVVISFCYKVKVLEHTHTYSIISDFEVIVVHM